MDITRDQVEWAVVDRLGSMLSDPHLTTGEYPVTLSYALLLSIAAWTRQRIGKCGSLNEWPPEFLKCLLARVVDPPWCIPVQNLSGQTQAYVDGGTEKCVARELTEASAWELLVFLRNAMAHGDHRNIEPISRPEPSGARTLVGFKICNRKPFKGSVELHHEDMARLGSTAARLFCGAYMLQPNEIEDVRQGGGIPEEASQAA